jgi:hypothetical protein
MTPDRVAEAHCIVGHKQRAYECPGCTEARGTPCDLDHWRWYRTRTSSKRIRDAVTAVIAKRAL